MVTAVAQLPTVARLAESVQAAGDERRPPSASCCAPLIGAIVVSAVLHAGVGVLALCAVPQALDGKPEASISVELVMEAPPLGAGGGTAGDGAATITLATGSPTAVAADAPDAEAANPPVVETPAPEADVPVPDVAASPPRLEAKPKASSKTTAAPQRQKKRTQPAATVSPKQQEIAKPTTTNASNDAVSTTQAAPAIMADPGTAEPGKAASVSDGPAEPGTGGGGAASTGHSGARMAAAGGGRAQILDAYARVLWARIAAHKPKGLRLAGRTGISFTVAADGSLLAARIARPSGNEELDRLALQAVQAAAPMPLPPAALGPQPLTFDIPFTFR